MPEYLTPGVYVEETSFRAPSIEGVGTSTAGFVGPTLTGPISPDPAQKPDANPPELLTSFGDFETTYGGYDNVQLSNDPTDIKNINYLALSVKAFFDNGGSRLYVSRVFTKVQGDGTATDAGKIFTARFPGSFLNNPKKDPSRPKVTVVLTAAKTQKFDQLPPGTLVVDALPASVGLKTIERKNKIVTATLAGKFTGDKVTVAGVTDNSFNGTFDVTGGSGTETLTWAQDGADANVNDGKGTVSSSASFYTNGTTSTFTKIGGADKLDTTKSALVATVAVSAPAASGAVSVFEGLGLGKDHPQYIGKVLAQNPPRRIDALENQVFLSKDFNSANDLYNEFFGGWTDFTKAPSKDYFLDGGNDGGTPSSSDYETALKSLEALEDIAIVAAPGSSAFGDDTAQKVMNSLITHVERPRAYRVAILETPPNKIASDVKDVRSQIDSTRAALYTPWIITPNPLARPGTAVAAEVSVPPTGFMAGIYARNDQQHSVAKAPANEVVFGALRFERNINFAEQGVLNPMGINCLRFFPGRGYRVWGARTASSDSELKYINVRRYLVYLEHSIDIGTQWCVFENNGPLLWARVKESVEEFLYNEFREGNLLGTSPPEAYFVKCDRSTMTQNDLDNGRLICLVGVALLKPAEFVIFRIGQKTMEQRA